MFRRSCFWVMDHADSRDHLERISGSNSMAIDQDSLDSGENESETPDE